MKLLTTSTMKNKALACSALALTCFLAVPAQAQEAAIRKNLPERLPSLPPIDEVQKTPMPGLFEVRVNGNEIFYTDSTGSFLIQGSLIDAKAKRNLTEERTDKLNRVAFDSLPIKDAVTIVRGNGKRKLAVFEDPNCGYCKRFERDMQQVNDVTVHLFLLPILSADSAEKSKNVWCAADKAKAWTDMMVAGKTLPATNCDTSAITRNLEFGRKYRITGTPTLIFADGSRIPGALSAQQVEQHLAQAKAP
jgi:thiol:disulfide interchange protein DsbC